MGHMKNILIESEGDIPLAEEKLKKIAQARKDKVDSLTSKVEKAMADKRIRYSLAKSIAQILLLIDKE